MRSELHSLNHPLAGSEVSAANAARHGRRRGSLLLIPRLPHIPGRLQGPLSLLPPSKRALSGRSLPDPSPSCRSFSGLSRAAARDPPSRQRSPLHLSAGSVVAVLIFPLALSSLCLLSELCSGAVFPPREERVNCGGSIEPCHSLVRNPQ